MVERERNHRVKLKYNTHPQARVRGFCKFNDYHYLRRMNSITQQYVMAVFAVKYRLGMIDSRWAPDFYAMLGKILNDMDGVRPLKINGYRDHVHVLYSTRGMIADTEIVRRLKTESSRWLNEKRWTLGRFGWQRGGARITCSPSGLPRLKAYIDNQWEHHRVKTFREEYEGWLRSLGLTTSKYDLPEDPQ